MKIHALMENTACSPDFSAEHGLSLYIEAGEQNILFDTGAGGKFAENAERMGLDIGKVDLAFLSHGHNDHGGGLKRFLELNDRAPIYISPLSFGPYYNAKDEYIGLDEELEGNPRMVFLKEPKVIGNAQLFPCFSALSYPLDSAGLKEKQGSEFIPDKFLHEQYMLLNEGGKRILLSGCSHRGILNIMNEFKPDVLVGGFHFMRQEIINGKNAVLDEAAKVLMNYDCVYYTCHCTGLPQYDYLKKSMGERLHYLSAGQSIEL